MKTHARIDWGKARQEFTATKGMSLKDVAEKYKMSYSMVLKVSMREGWVKEKERVWGEAEKGALVETEGSIKDLITRHSKVARFLQAGALNQLKIVVQYLQEHPAVLQTTNLVALAKIIQALTGMSGEGLKAERELYPKQMKLEGDLDVKYTEVSPELRKAAHDALVKATSSKPRERTGDNRKKQG